MPLARIEGCVLHFVHIPKTGGSSINSYLRAKGSLALYSREPVDCMAVSPQHLHRTPCRSIVPDAFSDAAFTVLRDPVDRMVSEYRYRAARRARAAGSDSDPCVEWHDGSAFAGGFDAWVCAALEEVAADP